MARLVVSVPMMYADHHVLRAREALQKLAGVSNIVASATRKQVVVDYDPPLTAPEIESALTTAGYPPNQEQPLPSIIERSKDGSAWYAVIGRKTTTERKDLEMSGDFRRY